MRQVDFDGHILNKISLQRDIFANSEAKCPVIKSQINVCVVLVKDRKFFQHHFRLR